MSATETKLMTADELLTLPSFVEGGDRRYELIKGVLKIMSPTEPLHGVICARIAARLVSFVEEHDLGEVFCVETGFLVETDPDTVVGADAAFVSRERLETVETFEKFFPFAPDLAVEVLSPSNTVNEIDEKINFYFAAGAREQSGSSTRSAAPSRPTPRLSTCESCASRRRSKAETFCRDSGLSFQNCSP